MHRFVVWTVVSDLPTSRTSGLRNRLEGVFCCCLVRKGSYSSPFGAMRWKCNPFSPSPTGMYVVPTLPPHFFRYLLMKLGIARS